jgi:hypothetical protein
MRRGPLEERRDWLVQCHLVYFTVEFRLCVYLKGLMTVR